MQFYKSTNGFPPNNCIYPCVVLAMDEWDDYSYRTAFTMIYFLSENEQKLIGELKILRDLYDEEFEKDTPYYYTKLYLEDKFTELNDDFCSLGQNLSYYEKLYELGEEVSKEILKSLNDVAINDKIRKKFKHHRGFQNSLVRYSSAEKALHEAKEIFGEEIVKLYKFTFKSKLPLATKEHEIKFDFREDIFLPYRISVLIGKNGTGKTQIMARIANALSGHEVEEQGTFEPSRRPSFGQVIAVSYSVFDEFDRPEEGETTYSYKYCGLRDSTGNIYTKEDLYDKFTISFNAIKGTEKEKFWKEVLEEIVEPEHRSILEILSSGNSHANMSSGQNIIITIITEVISNIENDSILLIDEPELHLHPNAISNFYRMLYKLLEKFNSFAIISTHSPLIIQETPSRYINVFERIENTPIVRKLDIESFGENLSVITDKIFGVTDEESNYKYWLRELSNHKNFDNVLNEFDGQLSLNAMAYLSALYSKGQG
ncbi:ATP-binding protein [Priestia aryabhattai]|uniref:AAA family ATPase n=1 Tax=Priestia TaxID=2800373 RepID=UPI001C8DFA3F|nr:MULTISPECIES: AAA family ATPase [Priestia]MBY0027939.1 ATP-binding protein [Priestia aryabhattai]MCU7711122.1 ATP-binding protein [Priestia megaterium]MCW1044151.1 ATP-binding protein [Priestia sp. JV24]